ncbi:pyridoxamine 5'-phosphate oxidase family protein [Nocardia sp. NPDC052254]|uniref:pyridoxamine 5'-phosphate oxidase family protein n=1 Tax=Nocardia sp. NPDC052254 TaxID=3155681 RepID=UPI0034250F23
MPTMTSSEREQFLAEVHVGVIAVERADRAPLAVPIWYDYEPGGDVLVWTEAGTVKDKLIRAAQRFSLTAQVEQPPYRYVTAEGPVVGIEPATSEIVGSLAVRYMGPEAGAAFVAENLTPESIVIRMRPERWLSTDYSKE